MSINNNRETLVSSGVHIGALRRLGDSYSADEYLTAVEAARDAGDGERYATAVLGPETATPDPTGADLHAAALRILSAKGKGDTYTQSDYLAACDQVTTEATGVLMSAAIDTLRKGQVR
jgi:hypothetical protein